MDANQLAALLVLLAAVSFAFKDQTAALVKGILSRVVPAKRKPPEGGDPISPVDGDEPEVCCYDKICAFEDLVRLRDFLEDNEEVVTVLDELVSPAISKAER